MESARLFFPFPFERPSDLMESSSTYLTRTFARSPFHLTFLRGFFRQCLAPLSPAGPQALHQLL